MKPRQVALAAILLAGAVALAFLLAGAARDYILLPAARVWWMLRGMYASVPQVETWVLILVIITIMLAWALIRTDWMQRERRERILRLPGEVQQLAYWITRSRKGIYSRWHLARRLADLALDILESMGSNVRRTRQLKGVGWNPSPEVQQYLATALRTSYADFAKHSATESETSLDADVGAVVAYLESLVENEHEHTNH